MAREGRAFLFAVRGRCGHLPRTTYPQRTHWPRRSACGVGLVGCRRVTRSPSLRSGSRKTLRNEEGGFHHASTPLMVLVRHASTPLSMTARGNWVRLRVFAVFTLSFFHSVVCLCQAPRSLTYGLGSFAHFRDVRHVGFLGAERLGTRPTIGFVGAAPRWLPCRGSRGGGQTAAGRRSRGRG